jgi:hypothetical protein
MKMHGIKLECPNEVILVLPRQDGDLVFKAKAVTDYAEFDTLCPEPKAQVRTIKGGVQQEMTTEPAYIRAINEHNQKRMCWIFIKSLQATEGLEWETVKYEDPNTWTNYIDELKASGFSAVEINRINTAVLQANCLDEEKLEAARKAFLAGQGTV